MCRVHVECRTERGRQMNTDLKSVGGPPGRYSVVRLFRRLRHRYLGDATDTFGHVRKINKWHVKNRYFNNIYISLLSVGQ